MEKNHAYYETVIQKGRLNLLIAVILSLVNVVALLLGTSWEFPFSASMPQIIIILSDGLSQGLELASVYLIGIIFALLLIGFYFGMYLLSKKSIVGMIVATILFCIDTLFVAFSALAFGATDLIINVLFHAWVLYYLFSSLRAYNKLKKLSVEQPVIAEQPVQTVDAEVISEQPFSTPNDHTSEDSPQ